MATFSCAYTGTTECDFHSDGTEPLDAFETGLAHLESKHRDFFFGLIKKIGITETYRTIVNAIEK